MPTHQGLVLQPRRRRFRPTVCHQALPFPDLRVGESTSIDSLTAAVLGTLKLCRPLVPWPSEVSRSPSPHVCCMLPALRTSLSELLNRTGGPWVRPGRGRLSPGCSVAEPRRLQLGDRPVVQHSQPPQVSWLSGETARARPVYRGATGARQSKEPPPGPRVPRRTNATVGGDVTRNRPRRQPCGRGGKAAGGGRPLARRRSGHEGCIPGASSSEVNV